MIKSAYLAAALLAAPLSLAHADEGMWTFDNFPSAKVKAAYGVTIDKPWLDRVRAAAVRLTTGCSASTVSPEGLVLTNWHCVADCAQNLSAGGTDYMKDGFLTDARAEEKQCPGMQAEILAEIVDVTAKVQAAGRGGDGAVFAAARDAAVAAIEKEGCAGQADLRCQVVTLYRGGEYKLYKYRKYADVRLVFAPEFATGFFGGDPDNFNFPRFNLDAAFLRLYVDGKPARTPDHLKWNPAPPKEGEPVFVAGNPGSTERLLTVAQLETQRDLVIPVSQLQRSELRGRLTRMSEEGAEQKRAVTDPLFGLENSFKVFFGRQFVLNDAAFMDAKRAAEADLRAKIAADPKRAAEIGDPWSDLAKTQAAYAELFVRYYQLEMSAGSQSQLYRYARTLVRGAAERAKPSAERLPEFGDARLALAEKTLLDRKPVEAGLEQLYLEFWLAKTREYLTADAPETRLLLGRESPEALSRRLVEGSRLADPAVRKALWDGGAAAIAASDDPMIQFVLRTDPAARDIRKVWTARVQAPTEKAAEQVAAARFAAYGDTVYPDATFTLRLSYGKVAGWTHRGVTVPAFTRFAGLYERATGAEPFQLAPRWLAAKDKLDPAGVFDLVTTNDIIGGNSGSPLINARGEVIGAAFDGNIHSLGGAFGYDGTLNRTVVVSSAAVTEALTKVYGRAALVRELTAAR